MSPKPTDYGTTRLGLWWKLKRNEPLYLIVFGGCYVGADFNEIIVN